MLQNNVFFFILQNFIVFFFSISQHYHDRAVIRRKIALSYSHMPSLTPLVSWTVGDALEHTVEKFPERECLVFCDSGVRRTFSQFSEEVIALLLGTYKAGPLEELLLEVK